MLGSNQDALGVLVGLLLPVGWRVGFCDGSAEAGTLGILDIATVGTMLGIIFGIILGDGDDVGSEVGFKIGLDVGSSVVMATGASDIGIFVTGACVGITDDGKLVDGIKVAGSEVLALGLLVSFTVGSKDGSCVLGFDIGIVTGLDVGSSVTASVGSSVVGNIVTGALVLGCSVGTSVKNGAAVLDGFPGPDCGCFVGSIACCCGL
jgi:hypothetical protein